MDKTISQRYVRKILVYRYHFENIGFCLQKQIYQNIYKNVCENGGEIIATAQNRVDIYERYLCKLKRKIYTFIGTICCYVLRFFTNSVARLFVFFPVYAERKCQCTAIAMTFSKQPTGSSKCTDGSRFKLKSFCQLASRKSVCCQISTVPLSFVSQQRLFF